MIQVTDRALKEYKKYLIDDDEDAIIHLLNQFDSEQNISKIYVHTTEDLSFYTSICFITLLLYSEGIDVLKNLTYVPSGFLYAYEKLQEIDLSSNITKIESYSFYGCKNLKSVKISPLCTRIDAFAFYNTNVKEVIVPKDCVVIRSAFPQGCKIVKR